MEISKQICKPQNWQDFESLCKILWTHVWELTPGDVKKNGRMGQAQHGVDVYGKPKGCGSYIGIQCKGKDDYTQASLTELEIDNEIEKAKSFKPYLHKLIFATTANKDTQIEEYIRVKNINNIEQGLFEVDICSWEDIVDLIEAYPIVKKWYLNNCSYADSSDVFISFDGLSDYLIHPKFLRKMTKTVFREESNFNRLTLNNLSNNNLSGLAALTDRLIEQNKRLSFGYSEYDHRWCKIIVDVANAGSTTLEDYKLYIDFDTSLCEIDCGYSVPYRLGMSDVVYAELTRRADNERDVYETDSGIVFEPKERILVQKDATSFSFSVKVFSHETKNLGFKWRFRSRDYHKDGELLVKIAPIYVDKLITEYTETRELDGYIETEITPYVTSNR